MAKKYTLLLVLALLQAMLLTPTWASEVSIHTMEEVEETFQSSDQAVMLEQLADSFITTVLDVRTTTFFVTERSDSYDDEDGNGDGDEESETIDVFPWKSTQRIVFTLTNPVDTHQVKVLNFTASLHNEAGKLIKGALPLVRVDSDIVLQDHETRSLAYVFKVVGAKLREGQVYTFKVAINCQETEMLQV